MNNPSSSPLKAQLLVMTRDDLVDIAKAFADAIERPYLLQRHRPVTVNLRGTVGDGKKLVADTVRERVLGPACECEFYGKHEYDEFWTREVMGRKIEVNFINLAWGGEYGSRVLRKLEKPGELEHAFGLMRHHGGIDLIQNKRESAHVSVDIWLERRGASTANWEKSRARESGLSEAFLRAHDAGLPSQWLRYAEITVYDERLKMSQPMIEAVNRLSAASAAVAAALVDGKKRLPRAPYRKDPQP